MACAWWLVGTLCLQCDRSPPGNPPPPSSTGDPDKVARKAASHISNKRFLAICKAGDRASGQSALCRSSHEVMNNMIHRVYNVEDAQVAEESIKKDFYFCWCVWLNRSNLAHRKSRESQIRELFNFSGANLLLDPGALEPFSMCFNNTPQIICGRNYDDLMRVGSQVTYGPDCRRAIQDHIIQNRLTPLTWRKNFEDVFISMHLTENGQHLVDLMRSKVERCVRDRVADMVKGGLIQTSNETGEVVYNWRSDADNFLGSPGWCRDWSVEHGRSLAAGSNKNKRPPKAVVPVKVEKPHPKSNRPSLVSKSSTPSKPKPSNFVNANNHTGGRGNVITNAGSNNLVFITGGFGNGNDHQQRGGKPNDTASGDNSGGVYPLPDDSDSDEDMADFDCEDTEVGYGGLENKSRVACGGFIPLPTPPLTPLAPTRISHQQSFTCTSPYERIYPTPPSTILGHRDFTQDDNLCSIHPSDSASQAPVPRGKAPERYPDPRKNNQERSRGGDSVGVFEKPQGVDLGRLREDFSRTSLDDLYEAFYEAADEAIELVVLRSRVELSCRHRDLVLTIVEKRNYYCWLAGMIHRAIAERCGVVDGLDPTLAGAVAVLQIVCIKNPLLSGTQGG
ncbi:hypothetical protein G7046_g6906 [Stylonectria norvegica]|nr:hypothetical protein G7046_g6906 [Stylonectria norvegica]